MAKRSKPERQQELSPEEEEEQLRQPVVALRPMPKRKPAKRRPKEDFKQAAFRAVQEMIRRAES